MEKLHDFQTVAALKQSLYTQFEDKIKQLTSDNVYIYGANDGALNVFDKGMLLGYNFKGFIDNNPLDNIVASQHREGLSILPLKEIDLSTNPLIIITARACYEEVEKSLLDRGHTNYINSYIITDLIYSNKVTESLIDDYDEYIKCRNLYKDATSQLIFDKIVQYRLTFDRQYITEAFNASVSVEDRFNVMYFEFKDLACTENAVFVDGGGYDGTTSIEFINHCPNKQYKKIYYFEPDPKSMENSKKNLTPYNNIEYIQKGLFSRTDTLFFNAEGSQASSIVENGNISIEVTSLDEMIQEPISFIKLDIESAELPALKGAHRHISEDTPVMAICIYHTPEELYTIPLYLHKNYGDKYDFHLRQYVPHTHETVLYAIPKNKK